MIFYKNTVDLRGMQPQAMFIITVVDQVLTYHGFKETWITSVCDMTSDRLPNSLHPKGLAVDFRLPSNTLKSEFSISDQMMFGYIKAKLGPQFDVVLEKDHIHVEFDPKN